MRPGAIELFPSPSKTGLRRLVLTRDYQLRRIVVGQGISGTANNPPFFQIAHEGDILLKRASPQNALSNVPIISAIRISNTGFGYADAVGDEELISILNMLSIHAQHFLYHEDIGVYQHEIPSTSCTPSPNHS